MFNNEQAGQSSSADFPDFHKTVLDAIPHAIFVVDEDVRIIDCNSAAQQMLGAFPAAYVNQKTGDALHCINAYEAPGGCGTGAACHECVIRNSVKDAMAGDKVSRRRCEVSLVREKRKPVEIQMLVTSAPVSVAGRRLALLVLEDVTELLLLRTIIPMCAGCRKVRNDGQYWQQVEGYFKSRLGVDFSHGLCPDCAARLYPEFDLFPESDR